MQRPTLIRGNGEHVLIVDDDEPVRTFVSRSLERLGYSVHSVASGDEACVTLETEAFDLVFTDIVMPGNTDGIDLALKLDEASDSPRVLLTSGFAQRPHQQAILEKKGLEILWKPYTLADLASAVGNTISDRDD